MMMRRTPSEIHFENGEHTAYYFLIKQVVLFFHIKPETYIRNTDPIQTLILFLDFV